MSCDVVFGNTGVKLPLLMRLPAVAMKDPLVGRWESESRCHFSPSFFAQCSSGSVIKSDVARTALGLGESHGSTAGDANCGGSFPRVCELSRERPRASQVLACGAESSSLPGALVPFSKPSASVPTA